MIWTSTTAYTCFIACLSSAVTVVTLLLLIRPGHDNMIATFVDHLRTDSSVLAVDSIKQSPGSVPSNERFPTKFVKDPWVHPIYGGNRETEPSEWWNSLLTPNGGFLLVEEQNEELKVYGVSMFHQLHCLSMVRAAFVGGDMHKHQSRDGSGAMKGSTMGHGHLLHCFDYIAQAIFCAADDSLERKGKVALPNGVLVDAFDGVGQTHQCRNATFLFEYVLQSEKFPVKAHSVGEYTVFP